MKANPLPRNCRIQFMVNEEDYSLLLEISELTNESLSSTVADLIQSLAPGLRKQLYILRKVHKLKTKEQEVIREQLEVQSQKLQQNIDMTIENVENIVRTSQTKD